MPPLFGQEIMSGPDILQFMKDVAKADLYGITCFGKDDGGGAQGIAVMSAQLFCKLTGHRYFHSPFQRIRFADGRENWDEEWENFFNLGVNEDRPPKDIRVLRPSEYLEEGRPSGVILAMPYCHNFIHTQYSADEYLQLSEDFQQKYWSSGKDKYDDLIDQKNYIAVHIRRGDVSADANQGRFTSSEEIVYAIQKFIAELNFEGEIHVFSQGSEKDFEFLNGFENVKYFLNTDIFETIHRMVCAKAIVAAKSAVSYTSGILSGAPVITEAWYHQPLSDWQRLSSTGIIIPHSFAVNLQAIERDLSGLVADRTDEADDKIIEIIQSDDRYLKSSAKLIWVYAQALLRRGNPTAYPLLIGLSEMDAPQSVPAKKTLDTHQRMGKFSWPKL